MKKITVIENSPIELDDKYLNVLKNILSEDSTQPFRIEKNKLFFNDYIIGSFQVLDLKIEILSRHGYFSLKSIFEMIFYTTLDGFDNKMDTIGFTGGSSFGVSEVSTFFCSVCEKLVKSGINGEFISKKEKTKNIKGKIDFKSFNKRKIPLDGLNITYPNFSYNSFENRIIKSCLKKIKKTSSSINHSHISKLLKEFDLVDDITVNKAELHSFKYNKSFLNGYYPITLELAILILKDLNINYKNGNIKWSSFLVNSNTIFENYIFKIIKDGLTEEVMKWKKPKKFAQIIYKTFSSNKSFIPDILIDYKSNKMECRSVLDVKNKKFNIDTRKLNEIVSSSDIYQMLFYCERLKTNSGGLIFPSLESHDPIKLSINNEDNSNIFILSLNMDKNINDRHKELISNIRESVLLYS